VATGLPGAGRRVDTPADADDATGDYRDVCPWRRSPWSAHRR